MGKFNGGAVPNYTKAQGTNKGIYSSKLLRNNPIITNPGILINRKILDIGKRLLDFLPKMADHLSVKNARPLEDPSHRIMKYGVTIDNKIHSMIFLAHDKSIEEKRNYCSFIREELGASWSQYSENLLMFGWERGNTNLLKIAEMLVYMGAPELVDKNMVTEEGEIDG